MDSNHKSRSRTSAERSSQPTVVNKAAGRCDSDSLNHAGDQSMGHYCYACMFGLNTSRSRNRSVVGYGPETQNPDQTRSDPLIFRIDEK